MSLPSIPAILAEHHISDAAQAAPDMLEAVLVEAMRRDLPLGVAYLSSCTPDGTICIEDPNSPLGKQLIRMCASDAMRPLAEQHFCGDEKITFFNCCNVVVGARPENLALLQIQTQDGTLAHADC